MKKGSFKLRLGLVVSMLMLLFILPILSSAQAQFYSYYVPYTNSSFYSSPFAYYPLICFPSPALPPIPFTAYQRTAQIPVTTATSLLPAPTLPAVPVATAGGVGVSTLIPTVPVTVTLPANSLLTSPLSPLITFTPLSLVGLTFAPVPVSTPAAPVPIIIPTAATLPTATTFTVAASSVVFLSLISNVLSGLLL